MITGKLASLRAINSEDLETLRAWRNEPCMRRFFREVTEINKEKQRAWFENRVLNDKNTIMLGIVDSKSQELIGAAGLCYIDWLDRHAEVSLYIGKDNAYIDDKFAPDALRLIIDYAFLELNLNRLWAEVYAIDTAKARLLEENGFALEGIMKKKHFTGGTYVDSLIYGLVR